MGSVVKTASVRSERTKHATFADFDEEQNLTYHLDVVPSRLRATEAADAPHSLLSQREATVTRVWGGACFSEISEFINGNRIHMCKG